MMRLNYANKALRTNRMVSYKNRKHNLRIVRKFRSMPDTIIDPQVFQPSIIFVQLAFESLSVYVALFCSLNWWFYRNERLRQEEQDREHNKK